MRTLAGGRLAVAAALLAALAAAPAALAQDRAGSVEITPFGGVYIGGTLKAGTTGIYSYDVDVSSPATAGVRIAVNANRTFGVEFGFAWANADMKTQGGGIFGPSTKVGELDVKNFELNAVFNMGKGRVIPYFTVGGGAQLLEAKIPGYGNSTDTRFAGNLGFGVKVFVNPHFGLRFDGRVRSAYIPSSSCDRHWDSGCGDYWYSDGTWYTSGEVTGGLVFAF